MSGIVCAVRGGPAGRPTIRPAIAPAQESGEVEAHYAALGRPQSSAEHNVFEGRAQLQGFAAEVAEQTGAQVVFSEPESS